MEPRLTLITLGVADIARARRFYQDLGFKASSAGNDSVAFFDAGGVVLGLFGRGLFLEALFGNPLARFDPLQFNWIG